MSIRYTWHANERMKQRKVNPALVSRALDRAIARKQSGRLELDLGKVRIVADIAMDCKSADVITVHYI